VQAIDSRPPFQEITKSSSKERLETVGRSDSLLHLNHGQLRSIFSDLVFRMGPMRRSMRFFRVFQHTKRTPISSISTTGTRAGTP